MQLVKPTEKDPMNSTISNLTGRKEVAMRKVDDSKKEETRLAYAIQDAGHMERGPLEWALRKQKARTVELESAIKILDEKIANAAVQHGSKLSIRKQRLSYQIELLKGKMKMDETRLKAMELERDSL